MKFLKRVWNGIKNLFSKKDRLLHIAVNVSQAVKTFVEKHKTEIDGIEDILEKLLPGGKLIFTGIDFLKERIPYIAVQLSIIDNVNGLTTEEAFAEAMKKLSSTFGDKWASFWEILSGDTAIYLSDGKIDWSERKNMAKKAKLYYDINIKNK